VAQKQLYALGQGLTSRLMALQEVQLQMSRLEREKLEWESCLIESAPEEIRQWLRDGDVPTNLITLGRSSLKIYFDARDPLLGTYDKIAAVMGHLGEAWKDAVEIRLSEPEPRRVEVRFIVKM